jgi:hypothetical protein
MALLGVADCALVEQPRFKSCWRVVCLDTSAVLAQIFVSDVQVRVIRLYASKCRLAVRNKSSWNGLWYCKKDRVITFWLQRLRSPLTLAEQAKSSNHLHHYYLCCTDVAAVRRNQQYSLFFPWFVACWYSDLKFPCSNLTYSFICKKKKIFFWSVRFGPSIIPVVFFFKY